ncbi:hypothetical protein GE061_015846 [Apolygus lucorum]|uniref:THAP-type domain-containing protein n=1 Tax=Apolygus lucorum TaxID=248454 RepID=A0A8S9XM46_APOLU|nr:hypothetical protein GE061_015846 [Apolygus lucorum]
MVKTCAAYSCSNKCQKGNGISFHTFPKDPELRQKWVIATKRKDFSPTRDTRLCSMHFSADAYQLRPNASYPLLKSDAIPTIFDFPPHLAPPPPKKRRILARQQIDKECSKQQSPSDNQLNDVNEEVTTATDSTGTSEATTRISAECQTEVSETKLKF